jgi:NAD(P)-dependent dehydrogenase (short-subunit alcohol dehydrogenase family)
MRFKDKVAIITGGNRGIGRGISLRLAKEGAKIVIAARDETAAKNVATEIQKYEQECIFVKTDVCNKKEVDAMVKTVINRFGKVDILVNNAAVVIRCPFLELTEEIWDKTLNINLKGYFLCAQAVAKEMVKRGKGGKITNITSVQGMTVWTPFFHAPYEVSKAGIIMLTKQLAYELAPYGINVNAVGPGATETKLLEKVAKDSKRIKSVTEKIPLGRIAKPSDVAGAVAYLSSEDADYITGITIFVDGGRLTW